MSSRDRNAVRGSDAAWSPEIAAELALKACASAGVAPVEFELIRFGTNAVYRLLGTDWILRLRRPGTTSSDIERQVGLAEWLVSEGYPANRPADGVGIVSAGLDGAIASFWEWVPPEPDRNVDTATFGQLLRQFHELTDEYPDAVSMPPWLPIDHITERLTDARSAGTFLASDELDLLESWATRLAAELEDVEWALRPGLLHGDAHTGNVLASSGGPVVIDFDLICIGPREWDLVPTAVSSLRFRASRDAVEGFCSGYGFDILSWSGWPTLKKLRELYMTSWLLSVASTPEREAEVHHRLEYWREPDDDVQWHAV